MTLCLGLNHEGWNTVTFLIHDIQNSEINCEGNFSSLFKFWMLRMWKRMDNPWETREAPMIGTCNVWTVVPNINSTKG